MNRPAGKNKQTAFSRRRMLQGTLGGAAVAAIGTASSPLTQTLSASQPNGAAVSGGKIKQSIVFWCFNAAGDKWDLEKTCQVAKKLGCASVELVSPDGFKTLKKHGLTCAIVPNGMPGAPFMKGFNNTAYHDEVIERTKKAIDDAAEAGFPNVIAFNGYKWRDADDPKSGEISLDEGAANCVKGLKAVAGHAEKKGVNVCIEHLNTRDDTHPMKGHPGYQGDDIDYVANIVRKVASKNVKLLFDIYHVQVMNGDVIRRIDQNKDVIGHVHTAGCPGRGELNQDQEIYYPAIMNKLVEIGYQGFVGQEFIPTGDPYRGLEQAVKLCDI